MKRISVKLKSSRGASMIFALLVFLLCVLAGTAALTAASANIGRYTHLEDEQRQYFSVASALDLIQERLEKKEITATIKVQDLEIWSYKPNSAGVLELDSTTQRALYSVTPLPANMSYFQNLLVDRNMPEDLRSAWGALNIFAPTGSLDKTYTITLDTTGNPELDDAIYPVTVKVKTGTGDGIFDLIMYISTEDGDAYPLKVVWPGKVEISTTTEITTTGDPGANTGTRETITTITITLKWSEEDRQITFGKAS